MEKCRWSRMGKASRIQYLWGWKYCLGADQDRYVLFGLWFSLVNHGCHSLTQRMIKHNQTLLLKSAFFLDVYLQHGFFPNLRLPGPFGSLLGSYLDNSSNPTCWKRNLLALLQIRSSSWETSHPPRYLIHTPIGPGYLSFRKPEFLSKKPPKPIVILLSASLSLSLATSYLCSSPSDTELHQVPCSYFGIPSSWNTLPTVNWPVLHSSCRTQLKHHLPLTLR